jgi:hypothetical protein
MRKVAALIVPIVICTAPCSRGVTAESAPARDSVTAPDSAPARPFDGLSGQWEGTANGSHRGECPNIEDRVHPVRMEMNVDEAGAFAAECEGCPLFLRAMEARQVLVGKVDETLHVTAAQEFTYSGRETNQPVKSAIRWTGDFKRMKDTVNLQLHAVVHVHPNTSRVCVIDGIIKMSKAR